MFNILILPKFRHGNGFSKSKTDEDLIELVNYWFIK